MPIYIPPLRNRKDDIQELAHFFLKKFSKEVKKPFLGFSPDAEKLINAYSWPGNIRELENAVERACVLGKPPYIEEKDLLLKFESSSFEPEVNYSNPDSKSAVNDFKKSFIVKILNEHKWNQTAAAEKLGIQRTYLSRLIKELEIKEI